MVGAGGGRREETLERFSERQEKAAYFSEPREKPPVSVCTWLLLAGGWQGGLRVERG